ncbi:amino acid adenylation domain-containing protein, partial [Paenibacillus glucanolyticus]|uniref:amino acid adenylation domain-containing protein n=1 Tax=Paenibacillus glucanolyticus TaxID=59843 RepID=UPI0037B6EBB0
MHTQHSTINEIFEEKVRQYPSKIALKCSDDSITYEELDRKANVLANVFISEGIQFEDRIAIMIGRGIEYVTAMMACLKAGAAFVPIDPDYPLSRKTYMAEDSGCKLIVSMGEDLPLEYSKKHINYRHIDFNASSNPPHLNVKPENIAYIIYTSGTTGVPKGVMVEHNNVVQLMLNNGFFYFTPEDTWAILHSFSFDFSIWEIFGALLFGGAGIIAPKSVTQNPEELIRLLVQEKVTVLNQTPSAFYNLIEEDRRFNYPDQAFCLRYIIFGGEQLMPQKLLGWKQKYHDIKLINMYGITETTVHVTYKEILQEDMLTDSRNIGVPIQTLQMYILNAENQVELDGEIGEICVGGTGVARGYLNLPQLTAEKFIPHPDDPHITLYKSGDLGRKTADGSYEFFGRIDEQVKIRGHRIELSEVTVALNAIPGVGNSVVTVQEIKDSKVLCGYIVTAEDFVSSELRKKLKEMLPDYMIPAYFVKVDRIPLNLNGKADIKSLPAPLTSSLRHEMVYVLPTNETERQVLNIWKRVLGEQLNISVTSNFFEVGGDSHSAIRVINNINAHFMTKLSLRNLFDSPSIRDLSNVIEGRVNVDGSYPFTEENDSYSVDFLPASSEQKRLYWMQQVQPDSLAYNIPQAVRIIGTVDRDGIKEAIQTLVERHEIMRTSFRMIDDSIQQIVEEHLTFTLEHKSCNPEQIEDEIYAFASAFDLSKAPLFRGLLLILNENEAMLLLDFHHIIIDGTSLRIILDELIEILKGRVLANPILQYKDYALWRERLVSSSGIKQQKQYWLERLAGELPNSELPLDFERSSDNYFAGKVLSQKLDQEYFLRVKQFSEQNQITPFMVFLAAFNLLVSKFTNQEDVIVGVPFSGRTHEKFENLIGMLVNTLAIRSKPSGKLTVAEYINELKVVLLGAFENHHYPYEEIVHALEIKREKTRNPIFDLMFIYHNPGNFLPSTSVIIDDKMTFTPERICYDVSKFDLTFSVFEHPDSFTLEVEYATNLFKEQTVERFLDCLLHIAEQITIDPLTLIKDIQLQRYSDQETILRFNEEEQTYDQSKLVYQLIEEQAVRNPDRGALRFNNKTMTYGELNRRANQLARTLHSRGLQAKERVGIVADRSMELVVAILAVMKAGCVYVPIDPQYPADRIAYMQANSGLRLLLAHRLLVNGLLENVDKMDLSDEELYSGDGSNLDVSNG